MKSGSDLSAGPRSETSGSFSRYIIIFVTASHFRTSLAGLPVLTWSEGNGRWNLQPQVYDPFFATFLGTSIQSKLHLICS